MRSRVYISIATVLFNVAVGTAEDEAPRPELKVALQAVQRSLDKLAPAAKVEFDGSETSPVGPQNAKIPERSGPGLR